MPEMEPKITINGQRLTEAQAMTIRIAIEAFADDLAVPGRLGTDDHAEKMVAGYRARIDEIRGIMFDA
jgi:hypothetical protein